MTATKAEQAAQPETYVRQGRQAYYETLRTLSEASVNQHFDPWKDIDWDSPEMSEIEGDERWILGDSDELGRHPWYKSLSKERQIEIGMYRWAQVAKVGLQFEQLLISGVMNHLLWAKNGNPEFRYATHEVTEETHHTQMFQEFVNRTCPDVTGASTLFKVLVPFLASAGAFFPEAFFVGILAGEEPIDHLQKGAMRSGGSHPSITRVMQIHIAEEARHIGFAHQYLEQHIPELGPVKKTMMLAIFPILMRTLCDVIMIPSKQACRDMGIPDDVAKEIWWDSEESKKLRRDLFSDVRMLADKIGVRNRLTRPLWRVLGIDGRPARYRAEPSSAAH